MHDIRWIRDNPDAFDKALSRRGLPAQARELIAIDEKRRAAIQKSEQALARRNAASKEIGVAKKNKDEAAAAKLMAEVNELKTGIPGMEADAKVAEKELNDILAGIPNMPLDEVPDGKDEHDNVEHHKWGEKRNYSFTPKQHFELGEALGMMDFETAAKLSGARFVVLKGRLARMERALGQLFLDSHTEEHGYTEVNPPLMVNDNAMFGTAQLPKFKNDQFSSISLNLFEEENLRDILHDASANTMLNFLHSNFTNNSSGSKPYFYRQTITPDLFRDYWNDFETIDLWPRGNELRNVLAHYGELFAEAAIQKTENDRR